MQAYCLALLYLFGLHCKQVGSRTTLLGCEYITARNCESCGPDDVSKRKFSGLEIEGCARVEDY